MKKVSDYSCVPTHFIAILGSTGRVGSRILKLFSETNTYKCITEKEMITSFDVTNLNKVNALGEILSRSGVRTIINCIGDVRVDEGEKGRGDKDSLMYKINAKGAKNIACLSKKYSVKLIHLSTEYVFDGKKNIGEKYTEGDKPNINIKTAPTWYGITKALGEENILEIYPEGSTIVRFSQIQSPIAGIFFKTLAGLLAGRILMRASDQLISPIIDVTAVSALMRIEQAMHQDDFRGLLHVSALDAESSFKTCIELVQVFGFKDKAYRITPQQLTKIVQSGEQKILRPLNSILDVGKFQRYFGDELLAPISGEIKRFYKRYSNTMCFS